MSKNIKLNNREYNGISIVEFPLSSGDGVAKFIDMDEQSGGSSGDLTAYLDGSITEVVIPDELTTIRNGAFMGCDNVQSFTVSDVHESYSTDDGILYNKNKDTLILYPSGKEGDTFSVPTTVTTISDYAFDSCSNLKRVSLHDEVTTIGNDAFPSGLNVSLTLDATKLNAGGAYPYIGSGITAIEIPENTTFLDFDAFNSLSAINTVYFNATNCELEIGEYTDSKDGTVSGVTAFYNLHQLSDVIIGDGVTTIPDYMFFEVSSFNLTIPRSVVSIGDNTLNMSSVIIYGYTGSYAETYASNKGCTFIPLDIDESILEMNNPLTLDALILNQGEAYPSIADDVTDIIIPEETTFLDYNAFDNFTNVEAVAFNATNCELELDEYYDDKDESNIVRTAFYNLPKLSKVIIGDGVAEIPDYMFNEISKSIIYVIPRSVATIGDNAFSYSKTMICGYAGSYAETYAKSKGYTFIAIG